MVDKEESSIRLLHLGNDSLWFRYETSQSITMFHIGHRENVLTGGILQKFRLLTQLFMSVFLFKILKKKKKRELMKSIQCGAWIIFNKYLGICMYSTSLWYCKMTCSSFTALVLILSITSLTLTHCLVYMWSLKLYHTGLLITYVALNLMDGHGQPALLYIVPFTLGKLQKNLGKMHSCVYDMHQFLIL